MSSERRGITPYRRTHVVVDCDEQVLLEAPWSLRRTGREIHPQVFNPDNLLQLGSGGWTLKPIQEDPANVSEKTDPTNSILSASSYDQPSN